MIPPGGFGELKQAEETQQYRDMLILHLDALTIMYRDLLKSYAKITIDENLYNETLAEMVVIMNNLTPKLDGGGKRTEGLRKEFEEFDCWCDDILIPKKDVEESKKLHKLYRLILRAYDVLGVSNI